MQRFSSHANLQRLKLNYYLTNLGDISRPLRAVLQDLEAGQWGDETFASLLREGFSDDVPSSVYEVMVCLMLAQLDEPRRATALRALCAVAPEDIAEIVLKYCLRFGYLNDYWNLAEYVWHWAQCAASRSLRCRALGMLHRWDLLQDRTISQRITDSVALESDEGVIEAVKMALYAGEGVSLSFLIDVFQSEALSLKYPASLALAHRPEAELRQAGIYEAVRDHIVHLFSHYLFAREIYDDFSWIGEVLRHDVAAAFAQWTNHSRFYHEYFLDQLKPSMTDFEKRIHRSVNLSTQGARINSLAFLASLGIDDKAVVELAKVRPKTLADAQSIYTCVKFLAEGHTAQIYCIEVGEVRYAVKSRKRTMLQNAESKFAIYNEIHARQSLAEERFPALPQTFFASTELGLIVSNWIDGSHVHPIRFPLTIDMIKKTLELMMSLEMRGYFEWDQSIENFMFSHDAHDPYLVDVGFTHKFDPKKEFNPNGLAEPFYSAMTVFKDNFLMPYISGLKQIDAEQAFALFCEYMEIAPGLLQRKINALRHLGADQAILDHAWLRYNDFSPLWAGTQEERQAFLRRQFALDQYYSNNQRINTTLMTKHFTGEFFALCEAQLTLLNDQFDLLANSGRLVPADKGLSKNAVLRRYRDLRDVALTLFDD